MLGVNGLNNKWQLGRVRSNWSRMSPRFLISSTRWMSVQQCELLSHWLAPLQQHLCWESSNNKGCHSLSARHFIHSSHKHWLRASLCCRQCSRSWGSTSELSRLKCLPLLHLLVGLPERMCQFSALPTVWERDSLPPHLYQQFITFRILSQQLDIRINMRRMWFEALRKKFPKLIFFCLSCSIKEMRSRSSWCADFRCEYGNSEICTQQLIEGADIL